MTFDEYIKNPMGKHNAVFSNMELYRTMYIEKFDKIMVRENNKVDYRVFKSKDAYYILFKIPSEVVEHCYYDVVIKFDIKSIVPKSTVKDCNVKFFSNDPYFCYTFAYAFNKRKLLIDELSSKLGKEFIKERAVERNPSNEVGYDKAIYFAYLTMQNKGLFQLSKLDSESITYDQKLLLNYITDAKEKILERQERGISLGKKKRSKKPKEAVRDISNSFTGKIKNTKKISSTGSIKKMNKTISTRKK